MNLDKKFKKLLVEEIGLIIAKIDDAQTPAEVTYFLGAVPGVIQRIFNFEFHPELVHLWAVLNLLSQGLSQIFVEPSPLFDTSNPIRLKKLVELIKRLREAIRKDNELTDIMQDISVLFYSTTGNGNYLVQKGSLELEDL